MSVICERIFLCPQGFISSPKDEIKQYSAELFAVVTMETKRSDDIIETVKELIQSLKDKVRVIYMFVCVCV